MGAIKTTAEDLFIVGKIMVSHTSAPGALSSEVEKTINDKGLLKTRAARTLGRCPKIVSQTAHQWDTDLRDFGSRTEHERYLAATGVYPVKSLFRRLGFVDGGRCLGSVAVHTLQSRRGLVVLRCGGRRSGTEQQE